MRRSRSSWSERALRARPGRACTARWHLWKSWEKEATAPSEPWTRGLSATAAALAGLRAGRGSVRTGRRHPRRTGQSNPRLRGSQAWPNAVGGAGRTPPPARRPATHRSGTRVLSPSPRHHREAAVTVTVPALPPRTPGGRGSKGSKGEPWRGPPAKSQDPHIPAPGTSERQEI